MATLFEEMNNSQNHGGTLENWEENPIVCRAIYGYSVSSQFDDFLSKNRIRVIFPFPGERFDDYVEEFMKISCYAEPLKMKVNNPVYLTLSTGILSGLLPGIPERFGDSPMDYARCFVAGIAGGIGLSLLFYSVRNAAIESARKEMEYIDSVIEIYRKGLL